MLTFNLISLRGGDVLRVDEGGMPKFLVDHLYECPTCFVLVANPKAHHEWHRQTDPAPVREETYAQVDK